MSGLGGQGQRAKDAIVDPQQSVGTHTQRGRKHRVDQTALARFHLANRLHKALIEQYSRIVSSEIEAVHELRHTVVHDEVDSTTRLVISVTRSRA